MIKITKPSAPIKPRRVFLKNPWVFAVLIICLIIVWGLNTTGRITLPHINLLSYFKNLDTPSFIPEPIGVPITYNLPPG